MTTDEIRALSGEVVAALWPDWWKTGETCVSKAGRGFSCVHRLRVAHEIPPPDLTEPAHFLRALKLSRFGLSPAQHGQWHCSERYDYDDTPELALLLALVDYVRRGKEKT